MGRISDATTRIVDGRKFHIKKTEKFQKGPNKGKPKKR